MLDSALAPRNSDPCFCVERRVGKYRQFLAELGPTNIMITLTVVVYQFNVVLLILLLSGHAFV